MEWLIVLPILLIVASLFLGGTARILMSRQAPLATRLRWAAVSVAPLVFMILVLVIFTPSGSSDRENEIGIVGEMFTAVFAVAVMIANWMTHSTYRSSLSRSALKTT